MKKLSERVGRVVSSLRAFPFGVFVLALGAVTTGHWLAMALLGLAEHALALSRYWPLAATAALASTWILILALERVHHRHPWPHTRTGVALELGIAWGVFGSGLWFAVIMESGLKTLFEQAHAPPETALAAVALCGVLFFSFRYNRLRDRFERVRDLRPENEGQAGGVSPMQALVVFLSTPNIVPEIFEGSEHLRPGHHARIAFGPGREAILSGTDLAGDIDAITQAAPPNAFWNWQQLLRAIAPHPHLRKIWIIGSRDGPSRTAPESSKGADGTPLAPGRRIDTTTGEGSHRYAALCCRFLAPYTTAEVVSYPHPLSFEDYEELMQAVRGLLRHDLGDIQPGKIMIDVTGGMKVTSIVGATLTLNRVAQFQYVSTNRPFRVIPYQLVLQKAPSLHPH